jgi:hypothetical protein
MASDAYSSITTVRRRRYRVVGETSMINATISPMIGMMSHCPPNQCCTAVYQSRVSGRKIKPKIGQSGVVKIPSNQFENSQSKTIVIRGTRSANNTINNGISEPNFDLPARMQNGALALVASPSHVSPGAGTFLSACVCQSSRERDDRGFGGQECRAPGQT